MPSLNLRLFLLLLLISVNTVLSQNFTVEAYKVDIKIKNDGYFEVTEWYSIDFKVYKHGIFRTIQTRYDLITEEGKKEQREIKITDIEVPGKQFEASNTLSQKLSGELNIKIGDPNKTIIGPVNYEIRYKVENAFLFEKGSTLFYWNIKPPNWAEPFKNIEFSIQLPDGISIDRSDVQIYSGTVGNTNESDQFTTEITDSTINSQSQQFFISTKGQAVTILLKLPKGSIAEHKPFWPFWTNYGWTLVLAFIAFIFYRLFIKYGKDDHAPMTISYFPPNDMDPAMAGYLINDRQDTSDIISLLPMWGTKGYLKMEEIDNKSWFKSDTINLIKLKGLPDSAPNYQKTIFNGLFKDGKSEVLISSLKEKFYKNMEKAKKQLHKAAQVYYEKSSSNALLYIGLGIVLVFLLIVPLFLYVWGLLPMIVAIISCIVFLILNTFMIKKNKLGTKLYGELKGFKQFIKTAETSRLKMLLKEDPNYFESMMGYALTFGAFKSWANKFEDLDVQPPTWYVSSHNNYTMHTFSKSFSSNMSDVSTTMVSSPSSSGSGGGSSGGGFGGGGGGSW